MLASKNRLAQQSGFKALGAGLNWGIGTFRRLVSLIIPEARAALDSSDATR